MFVNFIDNISIWQITNIFYFLIKIIILEFVKKWIKIKLFRRISILDDFDGNFYIFNKKTSARNSNKRICRWNYYSSRGIRFISINLCFSSHLHLTMRKTIARKQRLCLHVAYMYAILKHETRIGLIVNN